MKVGEDHKPLVITLGGICLALILISTSYFLSHTLTNRFVGFRDDYTLQQAFAAVREVFQFDLGMIRFARSVPMREESRRYFQTGLMSELDGLLNEDSARSYRFDFAILFKNGAEFSAGFRFDEAGREVIESSDPFVSLISQAVEEHEIGRPTGLIVALDERLCFLYACPLRSRTSGRLRRESGFVAGRWLSDDVALSDNYPEFTVRFMLDKHFDWPSDSREFEFASLLRDSNSLRLPPELLEDRRGGPGPGRGGRRGDPPLPRFLEGILAEQQDVPSALLLDARFYQSDHAFLDREGVPRTQVYARLAGVLSDEPVVVQMLLPRKLANAVDDSIGLVQWTALGIALLIGMFTFAVVREIHRRRIAEVDLVVSNDELRDSNSKKDRLLSIIAHDLRAPLAGVNNLAGLMLKAPESFSPQEIKDFATDIQGTSKRLTELLENLLNWARLQIGRLPYVPVEIDVSLMVHQVGLLFDSAARQKNIDLQVRLSEGLHIVGDQEMLRTVLRNLVGNAIQYTPEGGTVGVTVALTGGFVAIRVKDSGPGLPPDRVETLFELPSRPVLNDGDGSRGAGFGLVLCGELVERLEGHLAVDSELNEGTVFTVCIPQRLDVGSTDRITKS